MTTSEDSNTPSLLQKAYLELSDAVVVGVETEDEGFGLLDIQGDVKVWLAGKLGVTRTTAGGLISQLKKAGLYNSLSSGPGKPWRRVLKLQADDQVLTLTGSMAGTASSAAGGGGDDGTVTATPQQLTELWTQLSAQLDDYLEQNQQLQEELEAERAAHEATKGELETAKAEKVVILLPASLAQHLPSAAQE